MAKRDPLRHRVHARAWIERNPEKRRAHHDVRNALRRGELERKSCHCGKRAEAHHKDYSAPLDVEWLCRKHHAERHRPRGTMRSEVPAVDQQKDAV